MLTAEEDELGRRMEAHRAACAELESDPLIQHVFGKPAPQKPIRRRMMDFTARQAD